MEDLQLPEKLIQGEIWHFNRQTLLLTSMKKSLICLKRRISHCICQIVSSLPTEPRSLIPPICTVVSMIMWKNEILNTWISTGLYLVRDICQGTLEGALVDSSSITFHPGNVLASNFVADTRTAGSTSLLLQVALPCLLYAPAESSMVLKGGTNCEMAPQIDYMTQVQKITYHTMEYCTTPQCILYIHHNIYRTMQYVQYHTTTYHTSYQTISYHTILHHAIHHIILHHTTWKHTIPYCGFR